MFGNGTGNVLLANLDCRGSERNLMECQMRVGNRCGHEEDAGVRCGGKQSEKDFKGSIYT